MLHRHARPAVAGNYLAGAVAGACTTAAALFVASGLLSPLPRSARAAVAICLLVVLGLHRVGLLCLELPQRTYQIPRDTFTAAPPRAAFRFAFELGMGVRTYITSVSPYGAATILVLALPPSLGDAAAAALATAVGFGLGRSIVVASQSLRRTVAVDHPARWLQAADYVALAAATAVAIAAFA